MQPMPANRAELKSPLPRGRRSARDSSRNRPTGPGLSSHSSSSNPGGRSLQGSRRGSHRHRTPGSKNSHSRNPRSRTSHRGHSIISRSRHSSSGGHSSKDRRSKASSNPDFSRGLSRVRSRDRSSRDSRSNKDRSNRRSGSKTAISVHVHTIMISRRKTGLMMSVSPSSRYHQILHRQEKRSSNHCSSNHCSSNHCNSNHCNSHRSNTSSRFLPRHRRSLTISYIRKSTSMKMTRICSGSVKLKMIPPISERQQHPIMR